MSVLRNLNIISQMRLDVPHFRLFESGVRGDFDTVVGRVSAGGRPLVVRGFTIQGGAQVVSTPAKDLQLSVADGIVINLNASESGSFLWVPPDRPNEVLDGTVNASVVGAFVSGAVNYVGIDFVRETADSTIDLVKFKDPVTGAESSELVPLGEVLEYRILIGVVPFSVQSNIVPIAKVTVDYTGIVDDVTDARDMLFRLGSGGDFPNPASCYGWPGGRTESYFTGADKSLNDQKSWNDAIMTRLWELGGGQHWYDNVTDRNVKLINTGSPYSNGEYFTFNSGTGATEWQGLRLLFDGGSTGVTYNNILSITGTPQTVADGSCVYVDIDRTTNATLEAQVGPLATVGTGTMPGSRWILAWRNGTSLYVRDWRYPVGTLFTPATNLAQGVVRLHSAAPVPADPIVAMIGTNNTLVLSANAGNSTAGTFTGFGQGNGLTGVSGAVWSPTGAQAGVRGTGTAETEASGVFGMGATTSTAALGGYGVKGTGGNATNTGAAGAGGSFTGGNATLLGTAAGDGILATGGGNSADTGGAGGRFTGGYGPFGSGPGVVATGAAGAVGSPGVTGEGTTDNAGVVGTGHGTGAGVEGTGGSGGAGGRFVAGGASSHGAVGETAAPLFAGVYGENTGGGVGVNGTGAIGTYGGGSIAGVSGVASGTGVGVSGTAASASQYGVKSETGHVGAPIASLFRFTATKTGVVIVGAPELSVISGSGDLQSADGVFNTVAWKLLSGSAMRLAGTLHIPRGATITNVYAYVKNTSGTTNYNSIGTTLSRNLYQGDASAIAVASVLSSSASVPLSTYGWVSLGAPSAQIAPTGTTGSSNSGFFNIDIDFPSFGSGDLYLGAIRVVYDYTTVDFMV